LLSDESLNQYSLSIVPKLERLPNSHLSLLAMVVTWHTMGTKPYDHLICQTPPFRLLLGITEYLFRKSELLESAIEAALTCKDIRADDLEFYRAVMGWAETIQVGNMDTYKHRFEETANYFVDRIPEASQVFYILHYPYF
jgi:prephenate dehydrogenase (NADP+)